MSTARGHASRMPTVTEMAMRTTRTAIHAQSGMKYAIARR